MNRFLDRPARHRFAVLLAPEFPSVAHASAHSQIVELAERLTAAVAVFHTAMPHPASLPTKLRSQIGTGFCVSPIPMIHANDAEHWRDVAPQRFAALIDSFVQMTAMSEAAVVLRQDVQTALSYARWMQAWAPDLVWSCGAGAAAFTAMVAAHLLGLPRVLQLDAAEPSEYAPLLPRQVELADLVIVPPGALRDGLLAQVGESLLPKLVSWQDGHHELARRVHAVLGAKAVADGAPTRTPRAAFLTRPQRGGAAEPGVRPFLLLGAERTGSNLLVGALAGQSQILCADELFNPRLQREQQMPWLPGVTAAAAEVAALRRLRAADPGGLHARLLADGKRAGAAAVGFKLLYFHGLVDQRVLDHLASVEDLRIVHLVRSNRLRRWLSFQQATASDRWFAAATAGATAAAQPMSLEVPSMLADFACHEVIEERYRALFAGRATLELEYGRFVADLAGTARQLAQLLECPLATLQPRSKKTGVESLAHGISNWHEVRDALLGTRWATFLQEGPEGAEVAER